MSFPPSLEDINRWNEEASLPDWWTVDSTPGSESVEFAGTVAIRPSVDNTDGITIRDIQGHMTYSLGVYEWNDGTHGAALSLYEKEDASDTIVGYASMGSDSFSVITDRTDNLTCFGVWNQASEQKFGLEASGTIRVFGPAVISPGGSETLVVEEDKIGFFGHATVTQPTSVAVSAAGIHAALVSLGLIAA